MFKTGQRVRRVADQRDLDWLEHCEEIGFLPDTPFTIDEVDDNDISFIEMEAHWCPQFFEYAETKADKLCSLLAQK